MKARAFLLGGIVVLLLMTGACAPNRVVAPIPSSELDVEARNFFKGEYVILPGDTLDVRFLYNPEFNELALPVRPDGRISLQLAPEIMAAGLTPTQLCGVLSQKYSTELKKPDSAVIVRSFGGQRIFIDGEVAGPQHLDLTRPTTIMQAIAMTGGLRETARLSNVIIIRPDFNGKPVGTMVDLRKVIDGTDFSQNIYLKPLDIVYVPKSNIARVDKFVAEYITSLIPGLANLSPYAYVAGTPAAPRSVGD